MQRLSTGCRLNSAADNAANLSLSTKLSKSISGLNTSYQNTQNGINFLNVADGALSLMANDIQRIRNLALQSLNGNYSSTERSMLNAEAQQARQSIKQAIASTSFGDKKVFLDETGSHTPTASVERLSEEQALSKGYTVIKSAADFVNKISAWGANTAGKTFILMNDIDMSTITNYAKKSGFKGTFDGNGYVMSNLTINSPASTRVGLFGNVSTGAIIKNVTVDNFNVTGMHGSGVLIGEIYDSTVENCKVINSAINSANLDIGGMIGMSQNTTISNCEANTTVSILSGRAGGLLGRDVGGSIIKNCKASGVITSEGETGGLVGRLNDGIISDCYSSATANGKPAGGLVGSIGSAAGIIENSHASGTVNQLTGGHIGGFVGSQIAGSTVRNCFSTGLVNGTNPANIGGFDGETTGNYSNNYWNIETSGTTKGVENTNVAGVTGLTSEEISEKGVFLDAGYSEDTWDFNANGSPKLSWQTQQEVDLQIDAYSKFTIDSTFKVGAFDIDLSTIDGAKAAIEKCDNLLSSLLTKRSYFGASLNSLGSILESNWAKNINLSASKSNMIDTDVAKESAILAKSQILKYAGMSILSNYKSNYSNLLLTLIE